MIKFVSDLREIGWWFPTDTPVSSTNKTDLHDITEILLKVVFKTIKQTNKQLASFVVLDPTHAKNQTKNNRKKN